MILSTHPLAAEELVDAAVFYAKQATVELAEDFIAEFQRSIALLEAHPRLGSVWRGRFRRLPLRRFPYSIIYCLAGEHLRVVALAHYKRRPGYWRARK